MFDVIDSVLSSALLAIFCVGFFLSMVSVPSSDPDHPQQRPARLAAMGDLPAKTLWAWATTVFGSSLGCAFLYRQIELENGNAVAAVISAAIGFVSLVAFAVLVAIAARRRNLRRSVPR